MDFRNSDFSREFEDLLRDINIGQPGNHSEHAIETPNIPIVSTIFYPGAALDGNLTDMILLSSDSVYFYVSGTRLLTSSNNGFNFQLPFNEFGQDALPMIEVPENSTVIDIILHMAYSLPYSQLNPTFEDMRLAVAALELYGMSVQAALSVNGPLYVTMLSFAPTRPIDVYALAAKYDLADLATRASSHLMSLQLSTITDELAERIGAHYLKRLFFFHLGRVEALKRIILVPPELHPEFRGCGSVNQGKLTRAWALAVASIAWDARPDMSASALEGILNPIGDQLDCEECRGQLRDRVSRVVHEWSLVKRTI